MINKIHIESFKSLEDVEIDLGQFNVFVGANGSGKSNLLEAIGVLSAAAAGSVNDSMLLQRGVRPGVPRLYKSAFPAKSRALPHIKFSAYGDSAFYEVSLHNPLDDPEPNWRFKTERWEEDHRPLASRGIAGGDDYNRELGLAALRAIEHKSESIGLRFLRRLQEYVIYSPSTAVLRGIHPESYPKSPVGLSGGRLPLAVQELLTAPWSDTREVKRTRKDALALIDWAKSWGTAPAASMKLSPSAASSSRVIRFTDRFMRENFNKLSGYDASEGALYVLFLAVLAAHQDSPSLFAIDNADHGLNPRLLQSLIRKFSGWVIDSPAQRQVLMTSHNPAVLDGLPLGDDRVRLFTVDRDARGTTVVKRVIVDDKLKKFADKGWPLSRIWMNGLIGGVPNV